MENMVINNILSIVLKRGIKIKKGGSKMCRAFRYYWLVGLLLFIGINVAYGQGFDPVLRSNGAYYYVTDELDPFVIRNDSLAGEFMTLTDVAVSYDSTKLDKTNLPGLARGYTAYLVDSQNKRIRIYLSNARTTSILGTTNKVAGDSIFVSNFNAADYDTIKYINIYGLDSTFVTLRDAQKLWINEEIWEEVAKPANAADSINFQNNKVYYYVDSLNIAVVSRILSSYVVKFKTTLAPKDPSLLPLGRTIGGLSGYRNDLYISYNTGGVSWPSNVSFRTVAVIDSAGSEIGRETDELYVLGYTGTNTYEIKRYLFNKAKASSIPTYVPSINSIKDEYKDKLYNTKDIAVAYRLSSGTVTNKYIFASDIDLNGRSRIKVINARDSLNYIGPLAYAFVSTGSPHQSFRISNAPVRENSLTIIENAGLGVTYVWKEIENLATASDTSRVFKFNRFTGLVEFGDGTNGMIPPASSTYAVTYYRSPDVYVYDIQKPGYTIGEVKGIAARWNSTTDKFDVYVIDATQRHIKKYVFDDKGGSSDVATYTMNLVSQFGTDFAEPYDVEVLKYPNVQIGSTSNGRVSVFVSDRTNNNIQVYTDEQAANGSGTSVPTVELSLGQMGVGFGQIYQPTGIGVVRSLATGNADSIDFADIYLVSTNNKENSSFTKFSKSFNRAPTILFSGELDDATNTTNLIWSASTIDITATIDDESVNDCTVSLYYGIENSGIISTWNLIQSNVSHIGTSVSYKWSIPSTIADSSIIRFYAEIYDKQGAKGSDYSRRVMINRALKPLMTFADAKDGDNVVYLQNGGNGKIYLKLKYFEAVTGVKARLHFDKNFVTINASDITVGDIWTNQSQIGNYLFDARVQGDTIDIETSILDVPGGITKTDATIATIKFKAKDNLLSSAANSTPSDRYKFSTIVYDTLGFSKLQTVSGPLIYSDKEFNVEPLKLRAAFLGDLGTNGTNTPADTTTSVPNLAPLPDGRINFEDLVAFTTGWNGNGTGVRDLIADIARDSVDINNNIVTVFVGTSPNYILAYDTKINAADLMVFNTMWSWYRSNFLSSKDELAKNTLGNSYNEIAPNNLKILSRSKIKVGEEFLVDIYAKDIPALNGAKIIINYNPNDYDFINLTKGYINMPEGNNQLFYKDIYNGKIEINTAFLYNNNFYLSGDILIATLKFKAKNKPSDFIVDYDIRTRCGAILEKGIGAYNIKRVQENYIPLALHLENNYPNPFNPTTTIKYGVSEDGFVKLNIYSVTGKLVKTLVNENLESGYYKVVWDGSDNKGQKVSSGIYFYMIEANGKKDTKKMLLLK